MSSQTILFETITAADRAYKTLQAMINVVIDCNAVTYDIEDEEAVKWLISDDYCRVGARERIYPYPVKAVSFAGLQSEIAKKENTTIYQYKICLHENLSPTAKSVNLTARKNLLQ